MSNADQVELVLRVLLAFAFGSLVGLQREFRGHEAGIRTMGSTAMAAAMFTEAAKFSGEDRIAAYVVQGVAIVGAGIIFRGRSGL
ncbi:MAG: MgtC/SapB family protein, partial [Dehalococcoidia bacterium]